MKLTCPMAVNRLFVDDVAFLTNEFASHKSLGFQIMLAGSTAFADQLESHDLRAAASRRRMSALEHCRARKVSSPKGWRVLSRNWSVDDVTRKQKRGTLHLGEKHCDEMEFDKETRIDTTQWPAPTCVVRGLAAVVDDKFIPILWQRCKRNWLLQPRRVQWSV